MVEFLAAKHAKYFDRNLLLFPTQFQSYDSSHTALVYFTLLGLALLGQLPTNREDWIQWCKNLVVPLRTGFRGSNMHALPSSKLPSNSYDFANIDATFFCLSILAIFKCEQGPSLLDRERVRAYLQQSQHSSGLFCVGSTHHVGPVGEPSLRHTFSAFGVMALLGIDDATMTARAVAHIEQCQGYDGGYGDFPGSESHAGLVYCALGTLSLTGSLSRISDRKRLVGYLARCQQANGGFNGRPNKPSDTCYSFWATASLALLDSRGVADAALGRAYLLERGQHTIIGGFTKVPGELPDPLHSALSLAALALLGEPSLEALDPQLCLPEAAAEFIENAWR